MTSLFDALRLADSRIVALVGAGGKTSAMFTLSLAAAPAIATTTTHLAASQAFLADRHCRWDQGTSIDGLALASARSNVTLVTGPAEGATSRLTALSEAQWLELWRWCTQHQRRLFV